MTSPSLKPEDTAPVSGIYAICNSEQTREQARAKFESYMKSQADIRIRKDSKGFVTVDAGKPLPASNRPGTKYVLVKRLEKIYTSPESDKVILGTATECNEFLKRLAKR